MAEVAVIHNVPEDEMGDLPVIEHTEESLVELGIDPAQARTLVLMAEGKLDGDCIGHDPPK